MPEAVPAIDDTEEEALSPHSGGWSVTPVTSMGETRGPGVPTTGADLFRSVDCSLRSEPRGERIQETKWADR